MKGSLEVAHEHLKFQFKCINPSHLLPVFCLTAVKFLQRAVKPPNLLVIKYTAKKYKCEMQNSEHVWKRYVETN